MTTCIECGTEQTHRVCAECFDNGPEPTTVLKCRFKGKGRTPWSKWYAVKNDPQVTTLFTQVAPKTVTITFSDKSQAQYELRPVAE